MRSISSAFSWRLLWPSIISSGGGDLFVSGYLAVEFFFILSGYYAMAKVFRHPRAMYRDGLIWTGKTFLKFFPYVLLGVLVRYIANAYICGLSVTETGRSFVSALFEISLAGGLGVREIYLDGVLWYMSAMLIAMPLLYAAAIRAREFCLTIMCPVSICLIYAYFAATVGHIDAWGGWIGWCYQSLPRAWAGLCVGGVIFVLARRIRALPLTRAAEHGLSCVEMFCLAGVIGYMCSHNHGMLDFLCITMLTVFALIALSGRASIHTVFNEFWSRISEFSVAVYVSHITVVALLPMLFPGDVVYPMKLLVYITLITALAIVLMATVSVLRRLALGRRLKVWLLQSKLP